LLFAGVSSGCLVVGKHTRSFAAPSSSSSSPSCHPSQYWDGSQCRHKGKGHGARKHDGEQRGKGKK